MGEIGYSDVGSSEIGNSEVNEVAEGKDSVEKSDDLSQDLDNFYNDYLENGFEDHMESEINEVDEKTEGESGTEANELERELDGTYENYLNGTPESSDGKEGRDVIKCRNEELAGTEHPSTGVPFEKRQVEVEGKQYEVVVPQFEYEYDAQLPENKLKETDRIQFKECNAQLKEEIGKNQELRNKFDDEQLEQIEDCDTPDGYTWHHDADVGKMQLVDTETHQKTGHTGGRAIWGGGTDNR